MGKIKQKLKKFWDDYGDAIIGFGCIAGVIGFAAWATSKSDNEPREHNHYVPYSYYPRFNYVASSTNKYEWDDDEYKDDWEKLSIAANYLDLEEGESYYISSKEGIADDDEAVDIGNVYMTHYIDGVVVNPPEEEEEEDDNEEIEDEEIEENEFKITIPDDADDDVRELVKNFIDIVENGQIEITHF